MVAHDGRVPRHGRPHGRALSELTPEERDIVFHGPAVKKHIFYHAKGSNQAGELDFTYYNAVYTVENALARVKDDKGMKRVEKFLKQEVCPNCGGTRLCEKARSSVLGGKTLDEACAMTLDDLVPWVKAVPESVPPVMRDMAESIAAQFLHTAARLLELGLGYLSLDRAGPTLSTGERQRVQLARAVRSRTTGVLYVLDEPSVGLHPANVDGLLGMVRDLTEQGNSVVLVDHDVRVLRAADWLIELGPGAGSEGGQLLYTGPATGAETAPQSRIGSFLSGREAVCVREPVPEDALFEHGTIRMRTGPLHTVHALELAVPKGRLTAVTGVSGSGKTTVILESLVPALTAAVSGGTLPDHVKAVEAEGIRRVCLIDAAPIGTNVRSTVATYSGVLDDLRRVYAALPEGEGPGLEGRGFLVQYGKAPVPHVRRHGTDHHGCAVPAGRVRAVPGLRGPAVQRGRGGGEAHRKARPAGGGAVPAGAAVAHGGSGAGGHGGSEEGAGPAPHPVPAGAGLSHPRRGDARPVRRGSPAAEACRGNGAAPG